MVKDAVIYGKEDDKVLSNLIEMALIDIVHGRKLFPSPLDEPLFYRRYFRKWVSAAVAEKEVEGGIYDKIMNKAQEGKV